MRKAKEPQEFEFIFEEPELIECPCEEEAEELQEEIVSLAEDIIDLDKRIENVEWDLVDSVDNMGKIIDVLDCVQKANRAMLEVIMEQDEEIKTMKQDLKISNSTWRKCIAVIFIWALVLTWRMCYNVFF